MIGDVSFTDNSSWVRSRKFLLALQVAPDQCPPGIRIREAKTEAFTVKDNRGECESISSEKKSYKVVVGGEDSFRFLGWGDQEWT